MDVLGKTNTTEKQRINKTDQPGDKILDSVTCCVFLRTIINLEYVSLGVN